MRARAKGRESKIPRERERERSRKRRREGGRERGRWDKIEYMPWPCRWPAGKREGEEEDEKEYSVTPVLRFKA